MVVRAQIATASPRYTLLVRRHLKTGELAFHYCFVPEGQYVTKARLIRAAGLRWPVGCRTSANAAGNRAVIGEYPFAVRRLIDP